ncbi:MAG: aminotransferase class I/II-fold pyridoxal phosphate-dependent enzyme [Blautia sp.]|nr:aminotransferase class I/II-fold pyridoxal phosphate-dependent enzyme [Blautia sp.]
MKFDFTTYYDRHGHDALAVDGIGKPGGFAPAAPDPGFEAIPMWVADMNFGTAPSIIRAMEERIAHPLFGYYDVSDAYYDGILRWQRERNGVQGLTRECIGYENGVLGGVSTALSVFCSRGDSVLVHSPTYVGFTGVLENNGYRIVHSTLVQDGDGVWRMDYADMEEKIRNGHIHAAILCSPHNPCGRVWTRPELEEAYALFKKYDVKVISDEIWSDLILEGHRHIPSQSISDDARSRTAAFYAPSKTFNLAGLIGSYHVIYDQTIRDRIRKEASLGHYNSMNVLSMHALIGAYSTEGEAWLEELRQVLTRNVRYAVNYIRSYFDGITVSIPEGTYMLFLDCTGWCTRHGCTLKELEEKIWHVGVAVQDGAMFHGPCHLRMNLALPSAKLEEAMDRLRRYVFS